MATDRDSNSAHTPGPWTISTSAESSTQEIVCSRQIVVCEVGACSTEDDANARLIAAAPDLLGALRVALDDIEAMLPEVRKTGWQTQNEEGTVRRIRAALARATGEAL